MREHVGCSAALVFSMLGFQDRRIKVAMERRQDAIESYKRGAFGWSFDSLGQVILLEQMRPMRRRLSFLQQLRVHFQRSGRGYPVGGEPACRRQT